MVEYLGELRESVLEAYTGIIQGLKGSTGEVSNVNNHIFYFYYVH